MTMVSTHYWSRYSKKLRDAIAKPMCFGYFDDADASGRGMLLAVGTDGRKEDGVIVKLYLLVDETDGQVVDARFQVFGPSELIGAAEGACQQSLGKNYGRVRRLTKDYLDRSFRGDGGGFSFPQEASWALSSVIDALKDAVKHCDSIDIPENYAAPLLSGSSLIEGDGYSGWNELGKEERIAVIEKVLDKDIRPFVALDGGGVEVIDLKDGRELVISYKGACAHCFAATGATLSYIHQILKAKVSSDLVVTPQL